MTLVGIRRKQDDDAAACDHAAGKDPGASEGQGKDDLYASGPYLRA